MRVKIAKFIVFPLKLDRDTPQKTPPYMFAHTAIENIEYGDRNRGASSSHAYTYGKMASEEASKESLSLPRYS